METEKRLLKEIMQLTRQREELTKALQMADAFFVKYGFPVAAKAEVEAIRAALAKA